MVDVPNNASSTAVLETATVPGLLIGTYSGHIDTLGDHDWVRVSLIAGQTYSIYASFQTTGFSSGDAFVSLRTASGVPVATSDNEGADFNTFLAFTATTTGTYFIDVSQVDETRRGSFNLVVTSRPATTVVSDSGAGDDNVQVGAGVRYAGGAGGDGIVIAAGGYDALGEQGDDVLFGNANSNLLSGGQGSDYVLGNEGDDWIFGDGGDDSLNGGANNDQLFGGEGIDELFGGAEADTLTGGAGGDWLEGGSGSDQASNASAAAAVVADLQAAAANSGDAAGDLYQGIENLFGSSHGDTLRGNSGANYLKGEAGNDLLFGRLGRDILAGGFGSDRFFYNTVTESGTTEATRDVITDFVKGQDKVNLSIIDAIAGTGANDAFALLAKGTSASAVGAGKVGWYWFDPAGTANDKTILRINNDGDATIEMTIELRGLITLAATDFNL